MFKAYVRFVWIHSNAQIKKIISVCTVRNIYNWLSHYPFSTVLMLSSMLSKKTEFKLDNLNCGWHIGSVVGTVITTGRSCGVLSVC